MSGTRKATCALLRRLAANLKRLRAECGWTQAELLAHSGIPRSYISHIEQTKVNISLSRLDVLAAGLDCTTDELLKKVPSRRRMPRKVQP